jgi:hypothetical protein
LPVDFEFCEGAGCAFSGFGAVVFFDELQVDIGGGVIAVIEFATVDAEELEGLVEVGFGELGLQELGELGEVEGLDEGGGLGEFRLNRAMRDRSQFITPRTIGHGRKKLR